MMQNTYLWTTVSAFESKSLICPDVWTLVAQVLVGGLVCKEAPEVDSLHCWTSPFGEYLNFFIKKVTGVRVPCCLVNSS